MEHGKGHLAASWERGGIGFALHDNARGAAELRLPVGRDRDLPDTGVVVD